MTDIIDINQLKLLQQEFSRARDWDKFHSPKNLAMALSRESSELMKLFQWMTEEDSRTAAHQDPDLKEEICDEIADVMLYLTRIADLLQINVTEAVQRKMEKNAKKYPVELVRGSEEKYDEYFTD